jgi:hypothetical protein
MSEEAPLLQMFALHSMMYGQSTIRLRCLVAANPSITGMSISINTTSYLVLAAIFTASRPFSATATLTPSRLSSPLSTL